MREKEGEPGRMREKSEVKRGETRKNKKPRKALIKPRKALTEHWRAALEWAAQVDEEILLADGFEDAFIGVAERSSQHPLAVYDAGKCIEILVERDGMSYEEAEEFFSFNVTGAWAGEYTPLFLWQPYKGWPP
jgi:hypothetical protein